MTRRCEVCKDFGFVNAGGEVSPCPNCNTDSGYFPGEYLASMNIAGRCGYAKGGGGRTCFRELGHKGDHIFQCGR